MRPQDHAEQHIGVARGVAVAVLQAEVGHAANRQAEEVLVGKHGGRQDRREHVEGGPRGRIMQRGQVNELLDRAAPDLLPHPVVCLPDLCWRRVWRPPLADALEVGEADLDRAVAPPQGRAEVDVQAGHAGMVDEGLGAARQQRQPLLRGRQRARQVFTRGPVEPEREAERVAPLPRVLFQERLARGEIGERRGIGRRRLGARAREEVERGDLLALRARREQRRAAVELMHDLEDRLRALLRGEVCREPPADPQVDDGPLAVGDERIRRLLDTVVEEGVGTVQAADEPGPHRLPQRRVDRLLGGPVHELQRRGLGAVPQTGEQVHGIPRGGG